MWLSVNLRAISKYCISFKCPQSAISYRKFQRNPLNSHNFAFEPVIRWNLRFPIFSCRYLIRQSCQFSYASAESFGVSKPSNYKSSHYGSEAKGC
jgi:hypothetical protein